MTSFKFCQTTDGQLHAIAGARISHTTITVLPTAKLMFANGAAFIAALGEKGYDPEHWRQ